MGDSREKVLRRIGRLLTLADLAVLALCFVVLVPAAAQQDDAPLPAPTRYARTLGTFPIEGHELTVRLKVICYKESQHEGVCNEDDDKWIFVELFSPQA
jgi:hypothetical protein